MKQITEKEITETKAKTFAYLLSVIAGLLTADMLLIAYSFFSGLSEYLTYRNDTDDHGGKLHYVDPTVLGICGCTVLLMILLLAFVIRCWVRNVKRIEKKTSAVIISGVLTLFSMPVLGYVSICIFNLIEIIFSSK